MFTVAVSCAPAPSCIVYVNESDAVWPVDRPWNAASGLYVYEPLALIVTDAPLGSVCVSVPVPFSATTVFVSPGSTSVSLASTPGAATFSGVSSSVVPLSSTAFGGSLTAATVMPRVAESRQRRLVGDGERHRPREGRRALGGVDVRHVAQRGLVGGRRRGAGQRQRVADLRSGRDAGAWTPREREHVLGAGEVRRDRDRRAGDHRARVGIGDRDARVDRRRPGRSPCRRASRRRS